MYCEKIGVDINDVIRAAGTKPYGFMKFYPSLGVGGHCIPVDPIYLAESARENGIPIKMIELSADINSQVLLHTIMRAQKILGNLKSKRILVVGISYKPNISDIREAPAEKLIAALRRKGVITEWHDEIVEEWNGEKSVKLGSQYDLAIIVTRHDYLNLSLLGNIPILDTRGSTN
jgi:UDP-N-acetyl-D-glucosamine dehydrogenase